MVSADQANILSTSWGECETSLQISAPGTQQVENSIFEEAAAQGQTVFASSGDTGSDDCAGTQFTSSKPEPPHLSVDDPASQPYVVGVGGTSLRSDAPPLGPNDEVVWNDGSSGGGTGGGESNTWASPVWQAQSGVPGTAGAVKRLVPDVSSAADEDRGVTFYSASFQPSSSFPSSTSGWTTIGGTSVATPTWAAIVADVASSNGACARSPRRPEATTSASSRPSSTPSPLRTTRRRSTTSRSATMTCSVWVSVTRPARGSTSRRVSVRRSSRTRTAAVGWQSVCARSRPRAPVPFPHRSFPGSPPILARHRGATSSR